jgi:hypothetical protein
MLKVEPLQCGDAMSMRWTDAAVVKRFGDPIYPALQPISSVRQGGNAVIHGENFHALQLFVYSMIEV